MQLQRSSYMTPIFKSNPHMPKNAWETNFGSYDFSNGQLLESIIKDSLGYKILWLEAKKRK